MLHLPQGNVLFIIVVLKEALNKLSIYNKCRFESKTAPD